MVVEWVCEIHNVFDWFRCCPDTVNKSMHHFLTGLKFFIDQTRTGPTPFKFVMFNDLTPSQLTLNWMSEHGISLAFLENSVPLGLSKQDEVTREVKVIWGMRCEAVASKTVSECGLKTMVTASCTGAFTPQAVVHASSGHWVPPKHNWLARTIIILTDFTVLAQFWKSQVRVCRKTNK